MDRTVGLSVATFVVILALLIFLRARNNAFEVKPTDIVVAILPIIIFLLVTGKIHALEVGGLKVETAIVNATNSPITSQVTPLTGLPSEPIRIDQKAGIEEIPQLIKNKTQGLVFILGRGGYYYGPAIRDYLVSLTKQPFLQYIILENPDHTFFGIADARALADLLSSASPPTAMSGASAALDYETLARWLNSPDKPALKHLPGFISSEQAVTETTDKDQALQLMESLRVDTLPVVNRDSRFAGIVNQSRLTASLILDVAKELKK